ncbi:MULTISPECIES: FtsX-like permease family protein [unclassified Micromonospora]|uniref:FtsX-like permease family protein n=1 Tax=unclassified Micromonospora TaxID=2617518 RepID=UPI001034C5B3|nr:FtsX-like permease family protein [Verrucosispora sp. SN26_14.1]TBL33107.1 FtsX-like permease family protein [Verrucosispora sp. SN26_14.1]
MRPGTAARLALAGNRTDAARVVLTALSATLAALAGLAAMTVLAIEKPPGHDWEQSQQYANALLREPGLRGGTAFALLLLAVPVLALAGQSARLGAPARDRRLAALRLAGATPGQVTRVAMLETGLAALVGTLVGLAVYLGGRELLHRPDAQGQLALPTDVLPSVPAIAAVTLGLPLLAAVGTALLLRRVATTPLGVFRRAGRTRSPQPWPALFIGGGVVVTALAEPLREAVEGVDTDWIAILLALGLFAVVTGVVLGTGWLSHAAGRLLHRLARGPATLLAARRLTDDPWTSSRTFAALLASVLIGAGAATFRAYFQLRQRIEQEESLAAEYLGDDRSFYLNTMDLVDLAVLVAVVIATAGLLVTLVEGIVSRRRAYAALVATGVPRTTIGTSILVQVLAPVVPAVLLTVGVGYAIGRLFTGDVVSGGYTQEVCRARAELCDDPATRPLHVELVPVERVVRTPDVPLEQLALVGGGALLAVLVTVGLGLLFLRANTAMEELRTT